MAEATTNKDPKTFSFADAIESKQIVMDIIQDAIDKNQELIIKSTISIELKNI